MRLAIPSFVISLYVFVSLIAFLPCRPWIKVLMATILLVVGQKYLIYEKIGGSFIAPDIPLQLLLILEILYSSLLILCFLLLIKDGVSLVLWLSRLMGTSWQLPFSPIAGHSGIALLALGLSLFGTWQSLQVPQVKTIEVKIPQLPAALDGFSVVQLTDLHIGLLLGKDWLREVVEKTNALSPDLVALTGDMIEDPVDALKDEIASLGMLSSNYGVFGVTGNHEYYFQAGQWISAFEKLGITMLNNAHRVLTLTAGAELVVAGVTDHSELRHGGTGPNIKAAFAGAPDVTRILLAHRPNGILGKVDADLQLSGHTHGGHLFFLQWLISSFNGGLVNGLYERGGRTFYVSPGTGLWAGFSCRLGVPAEITRIILRSQKQAGS